MIENVLSESKVLVKETAVSVDGKEAQPSSSAPVKSDTNSLVESPHHLLVPKAVVPQPVPLDADLDHQSLYFNIELSWIDFNWRVLHLALDERTPLLERVRFVAITASNLDEFIQKRVGGLKRLVAAGVRTLSEDGRSPLEQLQAIREAVQVMAATMTKVWEEELRPALREQLNVKICGFDALNEVQKEQLHRYFRENIYPILTPLAVDPGHPFPFISNLSLSLAVMLRHPEQDTIHFARLKIPRPRWLQIGNSASADGLRFLPVEALVMHHADELFSGMEVVSVNAFRITRNADVQRDEEVADSMGDRVRLDAGDYRLWG